MHPLIRERFKRELSSQNGRLIIYAVPLFYESEYEYEDIDYVVVVSSTKENSLARIMSRDGLSEAEALTRYSTQLSIGSKEKLADYVIYNNSSLAELRIQVEAIYHRLLALTD